MKFKDKGMTILEVVLAFLILGIGISFMLASNKAYYAFREERQERQQMLFYAAGQMDALLEGQTVSYDKPPFAQYSVHIPAPLPVTGENANPYLEIIQVEVYKTDSPHDPEPVSIYTYRVKTE
ncbi:MAG: prepilin-type cleavage/methylation domain-containing protein [Desulfitobacteriia bacterium]|jgi:type II secretory pathway pseudopilin PulG